ncbi:MAG TPA: hypothetical protein VKM94_08375 [Blastocatellia bacterium]|nr:hypothetical protein [Blastocatellia bacterium]
MYCSACGVPVAASVSYCNRCGTEIAGKEGTSARHSQTASAALITAILAAPFVGMLVSVSLMFVMRNSLQFSEEPSIVFSLIAFLSFVVAELAFIWMLVRSKASGASAFSARKTSSVREHQTPGLPHNIRATLVPTDPSSFEIGASVTDHTTRTLDAQPSKRE